LSKGRPLIFGEVLLDCFPDGRKVLGGAPFNVAWNMQAFGQYPIFISRVGDDQQGQQIRETMKSWSMSTDFLQFDQSWPTGRVDITLSNGEPHFAILPNQAYDHISSAIPRIKETPAFLYHGSLALRDASSSDALTSLKRNYPCPIFLDANLRKPWWNKDSVLALIEDANWLKLNDDECRALFPDQQDIHTCAAMILDRFDLEAVFITMGAKGAAAYLPGRDPCIIAPDSTVTVVDTVGAGDAFSSVLLLGLTQKWPVEITLNRAQQFASAVVGQHGAISEDHDFYQTFFDSWIQQ
jgi:fructokinase